MSLYSVQAQRGGGRPMGGSIAGTVTSQESGESLGGATIALWNSSDSSLVTGVIGKGDGTFFLSGLRPGKFYVKVEYLGYKTQIIPDVTIGRSSLNVDLGTITLAVDTLIGEDVLVTAKKSDIEIRADRTVYNVENQPVNAGGNIIDVLKNVPAVEVDIDDKVSLRGSQNVAIMINDRPLSLSGDALSGFLKGFSADMVKSVEVIPNPSAKYDPDGMAGILNIVLKEKGEDGGVSGSINAGANTISGYNASGSLNWREAKFNLFTNYSFRYNERESDGEIFRENRLSNPITLLDQTSFGEGVSRSHVFNTTFDYNFDKVNSVTLTSLIYSNGGLRTETNKYVNMAVDSSVTSVLERYSPTNRDGFNVDLGLIYNHILETSRHEFSTEVRYERNGGNSDGTFIENQLPLTEGGIDSLVERQSNDSKNRNTEVEFQVDYVRPMGEKGRLETGYKGEVSKIDNEFYSETFDMSLGEFQPDDHLNNTFVYDEQIHAVYAIYGHQLGLFDVQVGLRAEQALTDFNLETTNETFENDYFSLFPSASAAITLGQATRIRGGYSKRINRPGTWRLNPFPVYSDRLNLREGNPNLRPEYTHSFDLSASQFFSWGSLSISPFFRRTNDLIERWLRVDSNNVSRLTYENFASSDSYGADIVATYRLSDKINAFASVNLYRYVLDGSNIETDLANNALGWGTRLNATYSIMKGLDLQGTYYYRAPFDISNGRIGAFQSLDLAVKKSLFNDKASVSLRMSDIFNTMKFELYRDDPAYYVDVLRDWQSQYLQLNLSWNFGKQERRRQRRRNSQQQNNRPSQGIDF